MAGGSAGGPPEYHGLVGSDRLWVRLGPAWSDDTLRRWRIEGNAHTHRGRLHARPTDRNEPLVTISLTDIVECSPQAAIWLNGFRAGQEAGWCEFLGLSEEDEVPTAVELRRWEEWNRVWRREGLAPRLQRKPPAEEVPDDLGQPLPWVYVAGTFWVCEPGGWRSADPQPVMYDPLHSPRRDGWAWPGSVCEVRRHCSMVVFGGLTICEDCHHVVAV